MSVRVELIDEAVEDLRGYVRSGRIKDFLSKLLDIEEHGAEAGQPLGGAGLATWRKIVVGNRDWRIIFRANEEVATVLVIGDRSDSECYDEAQKRLDALKDSDIAMSLAAVMAQLIKEQGHKKKR